MGRPRNAILNPAAASAFLDRLIAENHLKTDAALSRFLDIAPPLISRIRSGRISFSSANIIAVHEKTGVSVADIKAALVAEPATT